MSIKGPFLQSHSLISPGCFPYNQKLNKAFTSGSNGLVLNLDTIFKTPSIYCKVRQQLVQCLTYYIHSPSIHLLVDFFILSHPLSKVWARK